MATKSFLHERESSQDLEVESIGSGTIKKKATTSLKPLISSPVYTAATSSHGKDMKLLES